MYEKQLVKDAFLPGKGGGVGLLGAASSTLRGSTLCLRFNRNFLVFFLFWSTAPDDQMWKTLKSLHPLQQISEVNRFYMCYNCKSLYLKWTDNTQINLYPLTTLGVMESFWGIQDITWFCALWGLSLALFILLLFLLVLKDCLFLHTALLAIFSLSLHLFNVFILGFLCEFSICIIMISSN